MRRPGMVAKTNKLENLYFLQFLLSRVHIKGIVHPQNDLMPLISYQRVLSLIGGKNFTPKRDFSP